MVVKRSLMRVEVRSLWMQHHHQLLGPIRDAMALGMAIGLAYLSYRFLESPFLRLKERFTFVKSRAV
jgi:peptidoglycan/LPS O-acetylase OafA/YrhL